MARTFVNGLNRMTHACTGFGRYFINLQPIHCDPEVADRCEGGPSKEEASKDFLAMTLARNSRYLGPFNSV